MINAKSIENEKKKETKIYPCLMMSEKGDVVLFICYGEGTVVWSKLGIKSPGFYFDDWNMDDFRLYEGEIILSNE